MAKFSYNIQTAQIELVDAEGNKMSIGYIEEIALFPHKSKQAVVVLNAVLDLVAGNVRDRSTSAAWSGTTEASKMDQ